MTYIPDDNYDGGTLAGFWFCFTVAAIILLVILV